MNSEHKDNEEHRFIVNSKYYTICIYTVITVLICGALLKALFMWKDTSAWLSTIINWSLPYLLGIFISLLLFPLVKKLETAAFRKAPEKLKKHSRVISVLAIYIVFIGLIILCIGFIVPQVIDSIVNIVRVVPSWYNQILNWVIGLNEKYPDIDMEFITSKLENMGTQLFSSSQIQNQVQNILQTVLSTSISIVSVAVDIFIMVIISIYLLLDTRKLKHFSQRILNALFPKKTVSQINHVSAECYGIFSRYVTGKIIDSTIIGILCFVVMSILQLPYSMIISVIVGVTNMIPYFGPYIGAIPGAIILLMVSPMKMLVYLIMILVLQQFDGLILGPKILGDSTGLGPAAIIFSVSAGGAVAGVLGMFVGVPVVAMISHVAGLFVDYRLEIKEEKGELKEDDLEQLRNPEILRMEKQHRKDQKHEKNHQSQIPGGEFFDKLLKKEPQQDNEEEKSVKDETNRNN